MDNSDFAGRPRNYVPTLNPHTRLRDGRLHMGRLVFRDMAHLIQFWAYDVFQCTMCADIGDLLPGNSIHQREKARALALLKVETLRMLATADGMPRGETDALIRRSINAAFRAAEWHVETGKLPDDDEFYPWHAEAAALPSGVEDALERIRVALQAAKDAGELETDKPGG